MLTAIPLPSLRSGHGGHNSIPRLHPTLPAQPIPGRPCTRLPWHPANTRAATNSPAPKPHGKGSKTNIPITRRDKMKLAAIRDLPDGPLTKVAHQKVRILRNFPKRSIEMERPPPNVPSPEVPSRKVRGFWNFPRRSIKDICKSGGNPSSLYIDMPIYSAHLSVG